MLHKKAEAVLQGEYTFDRHTANENYYEQFGDAVGEFESGAVEITGDLPDFQGKADEAERDVHGENDGEDNSRSRSVPQDGIHDSEPDGKYICFQYEWLDILCRR